MWASLAGHNSVYHIGIQVPVICKYIYKCSPNLWFFLSLLLVSFEKKEFLIFTKSNFCILSFVLLMSYLRSHCLTQGQKDLLLSSKSFIVLVLTFISMMGFDLIFVLQCELRVQIYTFTPGYPLGQTPFVEEITLSLVELSWHLCQSQLAITVEVYFWTFSSIPKVYMSIFVPVPHHLGYCSHVWSFEIGKCKSSLFFFKIGLAILSPLDFHMNLMTLFLFITHREWLWTYSSCPSPNTLKIPRK